MIGDDIFDSNPNYVTGDKSNHKFIPNSLGEVSFPKYVFDDRFSDFELAKFNEIFIYFDRHGDGTMDVRDLPKALRAMGALVNDIEIKHLLDLYDKKKSGFISFADF